MTLLETKAEQVSRMIGRKFLNLTVPARTELAALLVREFEPMVIEQGRLPLSDGDRTQNAEQAKKILAILKERRSAGVTNVELVKIAQRFGGRIHELRHEQGYKITWKREEGRIYRYFLDPTDW